MSREELRFRWLYAACYELMLPDGRIITLDPYVLPLGFPEFGEESYSRPDYVLISHTHFNHITDIPVVLAKNPEARLYVGPMGAAALVDRFELMVGQICIMDHDEEISHNGIRFHAFRGKHSRFANKQRELTSNQEKMGVAEHGLTDYRRLNLVGSVEFMDYIITTPDNFRIFVCGGEGETSTPYKAAKRYCPDLVIRQASNFASPEEFAEVIARYHAQYVLPHHHENAEKTLGMPMEEFTERTNAHLKIIGSQTEFINPEQFQWHSFTSGIQLLK